MEAAKAKIVKPAQKTKTEKLLNTEEGPWVCDKCDEAGESTQEFVLYYLYRKHMTDVHNETFDTRLCKYCGQFCGKHNLMMYHLYTKHGLKPPTTYNFPKCDQCPYIGNSFLITLIQLNNYFFYVSPVGSEINTTQAAPRPQRNAVRRLPSGLHIAADLNLTYPDHRPLESKWKL